MENTEIFVPEELKQDIEHVVNGKWLMVLAKNIKKGNHTKGFVNISLMEEQEFKDFTKGLLETGIKAGIEYARNHSNDGKA